MELDEPSDLKVSRVSSLEIVTQDSSSEELPYTNRVCLRELEIETKFSFDDAE